MRDDAAVEAHAQRLRYAGTYTCCIRTLTGRLPTPEIQILLYLLPSGRFLFVGSWPGYELTVIVGNWAAMDKGVVLRGVCRTLQHDVLPLAGMLHPFECRLVASGAESSPVLMAGDDLTGWGLFSQLDSLHYLGLGQVLPLEGTGLPASWSAIEPWIGRVLGVPN